MKAVIITAMGLMFISACQEAAEPNTPTGIEIVTIAEMPALGPYSTAVKANGILYMSGIIAFDPKTKSFAARQYRGANQSKFLHKYRKGVSRKKIVH